MDGRRPSKRAIQKEVVTAIGKALLEGRVRDSQKATVDFDRKTGSVLCQAEAAEAA